MRPGVVFPICDVGRDPVAISASALVGDGLGFDQLVTDDVRRPSTPRRWATAMMGADRLPIDVPGLVTR